MLDAIADFWKPVKRLQSQTRLKPEELQMGSVVVFGFVPQPSLSGRKLTVSGINTYKFGPDILTSFILSQEQDSGASMIIAETGGEQYIAMSRRISISDRNRLFTHDDIETVINHENATTISVREMIPEYKGWVATTYKRELFNVKGQLYKGDHRAGLMTGAGAMDFNYTLMVSDNHEHALEIEKYEDGRVEVYATVYRRMSDVGEVSHPPKDAKPEAPKVDVKLVSNGAAPMAAPAKPEPKMGETVPAVPEKKIAFETKSVEPEKPEIKTPEPKAPEIVPEVKIPEVKIPEKEPEIKEPDVKEPDVKEPDVKEVAASAPIILPEFAADAVVKKIEAPKLEPVKSMPSFKPAELPEARATAAIVQSTTQPYIQQEIKAVNKEPSNFVNESIDCELQVANKIIDEAIRNEMRINDVVRRVIGLPVSQQESVQIPVTLTDQDYSLLAIRYGISASDHEAIKRRITEDLSDFSGANKRKAA